MQVRHMIGRKLAGVASRAGTERIKPSMEFHAATVRLLNQELQRIISRILSSCSCQIGGPWHQRGRVDRVRRRAHLKEYRVHAHGLHFV
ncbi:hypothetical protein D3C81_1318790 [compost metagenome]